tara:strand:- start:3970 stop:4545 length:576 start_codon:yes stop_codon:yes gene_type:complete
LKNIAIFGSGSGSNAEKILEYFSSCTHAKVALIASNNRSSFILQRAKKHGIDSFVFSKKQLFNFSEFNDKLLEKKIDFIVLAGFLLKIPKKLVAFYKNRIINIHPSLLPKYGGKGMFGMNVHKAIIENNEPYSGITIHLVNEFYDQGKILFQEKCNVSTAETAESLSKKISILEHQFFAPTILNYIKKCQS